VVPDRLLKHDDGLSHVFGLLVAGTIFLALVGGVLFAAVDTDRSDTKTNQAARQLGSASIVDIIVGSTGAGWYGADPSCLDGAENRDALAPESVLRFGLGAEPCAASQRLLPGNLSFDKMVDLQLAELAADPSNGHLDYEEARRALGLDDANLDFHIRTHPILSSIRDLLANGYLDPHLRPLYIGDYEPSDGSVFEGLDVKAGVVDGGSTVTVWTRVTNNGIAPTLFEVVHTVHLAASDVELVQHTPPLLLGQSYNATATLPKSADWSWATPAIDYVVSDPFRVLKESVIQAGNITMTGATNQKIFDVHSGKLQYEVTTESIAPKIYYRVYEGDGDVPSYGDWKIEIYDSLGLLVAGDSSLHSRGWESFNILLPGVYNIRLKTLAGATLAEDNLIVVDAVLGEWSKGDSSNIPQESVPIEANFIAAVVQQFDPYAFDVAYDSVTVPFADGGDIYPDIKDVMNNDLPAVLLDDKGTSSPSDDEATLANHNVIVVGSNVDHQVMTSAAAKESIRDWVYAGGMLIVLGSHDQAVQWLQPIFHSSIESASGGISTPDANHPVLTVPNDLDYVSYDSHGIAWDFSRPQDEAHFTHVLLQGDEDLLALSSHGEFGSGRVLLSAFQPFDMLSGPQPECAIENLQPDCAGLMLLHNLVTQSYAGLFLDYGPLLPPDRPVGVTMRLGSVWHPELATSVGLRVQVYVF
jgi:hypothetical protein